MLASVVQRNYVKLNENQLETIHSSHLLNNECLFRVHRSASVSICMAEDDVFAVFSCLSLSSFANVFQIEFNACHWATQSRHTYFERC